MEYLSSCYEKPWYWWFFLQIPVALGATTYQAVLLYKGKRVIASKGDQRTNWRPHQLIMYCACGISAGIVGGLLGLGGGFILGPLFLELGIPPQVPLPFISSFYTRLCFIEICGPLNWICDLHGNFLCRFQVLQPLLPWHFLHLCQWWNITFLNVFPFLIVSIDEWYNS